MTKKKNLSELVDEALENVRADRIRVLETFEKTKVVLDTDAESLVGVLEDAGTPLVKLLEALTKSNEQVVKLAQIKEREESKNKQIEGDKKQNPLDIEEITNFFEEKDKTSNN